ncbi:hypothetical protein [Gloeobacter violaceus]|uniref:hypothetical protein n=1 Tax=Gloeobacter violaceus TaxID=33072 RepID=UPI0013E8E224|nr:hypothetical protein [Gloeobacter violaceus]
MIGPELLNTLLSILQSLGTTLIAFLFRYYLNELSDNRTLSRLRTTGVITIRSTKRDDAEKSKRRTQQIVAVLFTAVHVTLSSLLLFLVASISISPLLFALSIVSIFIFALTINDVWTRAFDSAARFKPQAEIELTSDVVAIKDQIKSIMMQLRASLFWDDGETLGYKMPGGLLRSERMLVFKITNSKNLLLEVCGCKILGSSKEFKGPSDGSFLEDALNVQSFIDLFYASSVLAQDESKYLPISPASKGLHPYANNLSSLDESSSSELNWSELGNREVSVVKRHGRVAGFYLPVNTATKEEIRQAHLQFEQALEQVLKESNLTEDELNKLLDLSS